jgi:hypothetical protein
MAYYKVKVYARYVQRKSRTCSAENDFYIEANSEDEAQQKALEKADTERDTFNFVEDGYFEDEDPDDDNIDFETDDLDELDPVEDKDEIEANLDVELEQAAEEPETV